MSRRRAVIIIVEDIPGYDGKYGISEDGIVYNWEAKKFIFPYLDKGYYRVNLSMVGKQKSYILHRILAQTFIHNPNNFKYVDHRDRDPTNNSLSNLRWCSSQENNRNRSSHKNSTSKYKGVSWDKQSTKWRASIRVNRKEIYLGLFLDEIESAKAYNQKARELFGEFVVLNVIPEEEEDISFDLEEEEN